MKVLVGFISGFVVAGIVSVFLWQSVVRIRIASQSPAVSRDELVLLRDLAIRKAQSEGNYRCCIEPPCTMCFWEGNQWNNNTLGTCACDDLIAQGEEPCPQCARAAEVGECEAPTP